MTYRTSLSPQEFALAAGQRSFTYLETSCHCTTYVRGNDMISCEEPEGDVYENLEVATDFRLTDADIEALKITVY